jgi:hypothetical protein
MVFRGCNTRRRGRALALRISQPTGTNDRSGTQQPEPFRSPSVWRATCRLGGPHCEGELMNGLIYLVGLIVVIMAILSLFGLR